MDKKNINQYGITKFSKSNMYRDLILRKGWFILNINNYNEKVILKECEKLNHIFIKNKNSIRAPLLSSSTFLKFALDIKLINLIKKIDSTFYLNQQNLLKIEKSNFGHIDQSRWHRDLPYQDWIPNGIVAFNILSCFSNRESNHVLDILEGSHFVVDFPSQESLKNLCTRIYLKKGEYLIMNSFLFHRAPVKNENKYFLMNQVVSSKIIKQQIPFKKFLKNDNVLGDLINDNYSYLGINQKEYEPTFF